MVIQKIKMPLMIRSVEDLIKEFGAQAQQFIHNNVHHYLEDVTDPTQNLSDMEILHHLITDFLITLPGHYNVVGMKDVIMVIELSVDHAIILDDKLTICYGRKQLEQLYIKIIFNHYGQIDKAIQRIELSNRTFDMAQSIHHRMDLLKIQIISK